MSKGLKGDLAMTTMADLIVENMPPQVGVPARRRRLALALQATGPVIWGGAEVSSRVDGDDWSVDFNRAIAPIDLDDPRAFSVSDWRPPHDDAELSRQTGFPLACDVPAPELHPVTTQG